MESQYCFDNASMLLYSLVSISTVINLEYEKRALTFETKSYSCFECIPKLYVWTILAVEGEILKETNNAKIKLSQLFPSRFSSKIRIFSETKSFINSNPALSYLLRLPGGDVVRPNQNPDQKVALALVNQMQRQISCHDTTEHKIKSTVIAQLVEQ